MNRTPEWSRSTVRKFASDDGDQASLNLVRRLVNNAFEEATRKGAIDPKDSRAMDNVVDEVRRVLRRKGYDHGRTKVERYIEEAVREVWRRVSSG